MGRRKKTKEEGRDESRWISRSKNEYISFLLPKRKNLEVCRENGIIFVTVFTGKMSSFPPAKFEGKVGNFVTTLKCKLIVGSLYFIKTRGSGLRKKVLQKALEVWDLQVIPFDSPLAQPAHSDPDLENAFICHLHDHWFCIRKVNGEWYNFDSFYVAPQHLSKFYLVAYLDTLRSSGWSMFLVRGNFPKEFPILSTEATNGYGQWLSSEDAERITKACNSIEALRAVNTTGNHAISYQEYLSEKEDQDLNAAIAASLDLPQAVASRVEDGKARVQDDKPGIGDDEPPNEEAPQPIAASVEDDKPCVEDDKPRNKEGS